MLKVYTRTAVSISYGMKAQVVPNAMSYPKEFDFDVIKEDYTRWRVSDKTLLKTKLVLRKFLQLGDIDPTTQTPEFAIDKIDVVAAIVPDSLKNYSDEKPVTTGGVGDMLEVEQINDDWQEYRIANGFKLSLRPVITKVLRHNRYNSLREPIYQVTNMQMITDLTPLK